MTTFEIPDSIERQAENFFFKAVAYVDKQIGMSDKAPEDTLILSFFIKGKATYTLDGKQREILPNDILITQPYQPHAFHLDPIADHDFLTCFYKPEEIDHFIALMTRGNAYLLDHPDLPLKSELLFSNSVLREQWDTLQLIRKLYDTINKNGDVLEHMLVNIYLMEVLSSITRHELAKRMKTPKQLEDRQVVIAEMDKRIEQACFYMEEHYMEDISLEQLATMCSLSKYHFLRTFKKTTQKTPYQYLVEVRLAKSKELLVNSSLDISEIAFRVGFKTSSSLFRYFTQYVGESPKSFRKRKIISM